MHMDWKAAVWGEVIKRPNQLLIKFCIEFVSSVSFAALLSPGSMCHICSQSLGVFVHHWPAVGTGG